MTKNRSENKPLVLASNVIQAEDGNTILSSQIEPQAVPASRSRRQDHWDPQNLTLDQIASVKYRPLGGKG